MKKLLLGLLIAAGFIVSAIPALAIVAVPDGGTGLTSTPKGYLLVGSSTGKFGFKLLTAGTNITITSTTNSLTVNSTASGTITNGLAGQFPYFATNGGTLTATSTLFILPSGRIGVNSTTPIDTLGIQGGLQIVGGVTSTNLSVSGLTALQGLTFTTANGTSVTTTNFNASRITVNTSTFNGTVTIQSDGVNNAFYISSATNTHGMEYTAGRFLQLGNDGNNPGAITFLPGNLNFNFYTWRNADAGAGEGMILSKGSYPGTTTTLAIFSSGGRLGLGLAQNAAPSQILHVVGNGIITGGLQVGATANTTAGTATIDGNFVGALIMTNGTITAKATLGAANPPYSFVGDTDTGMGQFSLAANTLAFAAGGIVSGVFGPTAGRFGVGTTTPIASLSVLASSTNGNNPIVEIASSSNTSYFRILANGRAGFNSSTPIDTVGIQGGLQVVGGVTSTNLSVSGLTGLAGFTYTNATGTNENVSGLLSFGNANGTSVTTTNLYISGLTNLSNTTISNVTSTNLSVSGLTGLQGLTFTTAVGTSVTTTNLYVAATATTSILRTGAIFLGVLNIVGNGNYIVTPTSSVSFISVNTGTATSTISLPDPAVNIGREIYIKDNSGNADVHPLGVNYYWYAATITSPYGSARVVSDGNGWQGF